MKMDGMNEALAGQPMPAEPAETPTHNLEQCVPLSSLGVPGDGEQMENPEVGDQVNFEVAGKVTRIEGDKAYVQPESINGQPVEETPEPDADDGEAGMGGLTDLANQTGYLGAILIAFMLLLGGVPPRAYADRIADGKVAIVRTNGTSTGGFDTIAQAIGQASPGETVHVSAGIYNENNLAKDGITLVGDPGADIFYMQSTTNDPGYGILDDRGKGAVRMRIDWPGRMIFYSLTNIGPYLPDDDVFHTDDYNQNTIGAIVTTNIGTQISGRIGELSAGHYLDSQFSILNQQRGSNQVLYIGKMVDLLKDTLLDIAPVLEPGANFANSTMHAWFVGDTVNGGYAELHCPYINVSAQTWYWLEPDATVRTNDFYLYGGYMNGNMYGVAISPLYRWWCYGIELTGASISGPIACYGGGRGYFDIQKIHNPTTILPTIQTVAGGGVSNSQIYVQSMKVEGGNKFVDAAVGKVVVRVDEFLATTEVLNGITTSGNGVVVPHYSVSGLTNVAASANSLVVNVIPPMPGTNYSVLLQHKFNPVAIASITSLTRSNFTISYSAGVTTGGGVLWHAKQNTQ